MTTLQPTSITALQKHIERDLMRSLDARLHNWGRWWYHDNIAEGDRDVGSSRPSIAYVAMQFAPQPMKSGYSSPHAVEIDRIDAEELHRQLIGLRSHQFAELVRFYSRLGGGGTQSQKDIRYRIRRRLAGVA